MKPQEEKVIEALERVVKPQPQQSIKEILEKTLKEIIDKSDINKNKELIALSENAIRKSLTKIYELGVETRNKKDKETIKFLRTSQGWHDGFKNGKEEERNRIRKELLSKIDLEKEAGYEPATILMDLEAEISVGWKIKK